MTLDELLNLQPGDKVRVVETATGLYWAGNMQRYCGRVVTVKRVCNEHIKIVEDGDWWGWYPWMIERIIQPDVEVDIDFDSIMKRGEEL